MDLVEKNQNLYRHPWELSRLDFVKNKITSSNTTRNPIFADIGAGDQFFLSHIDNCSKKYAVDIFYEDEFIKDEFVQTRDLGKIPDNSIDQVFLLDVIEHVENDIDFLKEISKKVVSWGSIFITVLAFQCLFTQHDVFLKHFKRYNHYLLRKVINASELDLQEVQYFYFSLLPVRALEKLEAPRVLNDIFRLKSKYL